MVYEIVNAFPHPLFTEDVEPCISLYQPTHRHGPENQQDVIRFKNSMKQIEKSLSDKYDKKQIASLMKPLEKLAADRKFWEHATDGLALFATEGKCIIYRLQREVKELAIVAKSFHIKPLIRVFQSADRYHLLGINRQEFKLFEGNRYKVEEVELDPSIPRTINEALGEEFAEKYVTAGVSGPQGTAMFHGHGSKKDVIDIDTERFFRHVDKVVLEHYSQPMELPLYLVALKEYHTPFQSISRNHFLQKEGIRSDFTALSLDELKKKAWEIIEPLYLEKTKELVDQFAQVRARFEGSDDIAQVARAASENRINKILIEADRVIPGRIDVVTGELMETEELTDLDTDDVLDDLAEMVFRNKGEVVVLPKERMPSETGVAAIYRY